MPALATDNSLDCPLNASLPAYLASLEAGVGESTTGWKAKKKRIPVWIYCQYSSKSLYKSNVLGIGIAFTRCYATDNSLDCRLNAATPLLVSLAQARWFEAKWGE